jgi:metal transporter CNNM
MALDLTELNILKKVGAYKERSYAKKIYPLRSYGNLLLCSILLGCSLVNAISTLILGNYLDGLYAAIGSTLFIVVFGEIMPQAAMTKYALAIGAKTRYIMYLIMAITFVAAYPLSKCLDFVLGKEIVKNYSRAEVRELMRRAKDEKGLEEKQFKLISGALDFKSKKVEKGFFFK